MKGPSSRPDPDPALIERAKRGDSASLRALLEEVSPTVSQWALAHAGNEDDAADLAQEVLILLVRKLPAFRGDSRFLTWLYSVTRNQALEAHRREGRQERKMERYGAHLAPADATATAQETALDGRKIRDVVTAFLQELPQRQREVFQMAELQGLTSPEIGEILGVEAGGVRAALFKARRTLRERILALHPEIIEEYLS